jgi:hypothetical protein
MKFKLSSKFFGLIAFIFFLELFLSLSFPLITQAETCLDKYIIISTPIPGMPTCDKGERSYTYIADLQSYIQTLYNFALGIAGILATVMITFGGFLWLTAAGNPNQLSQAKGYIVNAIIGLILTLGAFTILNLVNPKLVLNLEIIGLKTIISSCEGAIKQDITITPPSGSCGESGKIMFEGGKKPEDYSQTTCTFVTCSGERPCVKLSEEEKKKLIENTDYTTAAGGYVCKGSAGTTVAPTCSVLNASNCTVSGCVFDANKDRCIVSCPSFNNRRETCESGEGCRWEPSTFPNGYCRYRS